MIGEESEPPYDRPPLSKDVLVDGDPAVPVLRSVEDWAADDVELVLSTRVDRLIPAERRVVLDDGGTVTADAVVLATGGRPRELPAAASVASGSVASLRTFADACRIGALLRQSNAVSIVGAGFIGCEVASQARSLGCDVTVFDVQDHPMVAALGREVGSAMGRMHRSAGVDLRMGEGISSMEETPAGVVVRSDRGSVIETDLVVVGVGLRPNVELAERAGIRVSDGIEVDDHCRTSIPEVLALGDVANHPSRVVGGRVRLEHHRNAERQAMVAASTLTGGADCHDEVPWFWSDQLGSQIQMAGARTDDCTVVIRADPDSNAFTAFYVDSQSRLRAVVALDAPRTVRAATPLISAGKRVRVEVLSDAGSTLESAIY